MIDQFLLGVDVSFLLRVKHQLLQSTHLILQLCVLLLNVFMSSLAKGFWA
jgi:hypothetical protein